MTLTLKNVTKKIRRNTVIDDVSLVMESGTVYGLCGYNGCGKTMLMRLIAGLIIPNSGEILFDDKALGKDMDFYESLGILIENPAFLGHLSGFDNLKLLASIKGNTSDEQIIKTIEKVGLNPKDKKKYRKYSLGMKQRLGIAAAIMENPQLVILDEPTNALDADGVEKAIQIVRQEKERGALVILTCHDKEISEQMCDVIFDIDCGKIVGKRIVK